MNVLDTMGTALQALVANKLRSSLTMLGIVIGVGAVIALMAVGQGAQEDVTQRIRGLGTNLLFVRPASVETGGGFQGEALTLVDTDADAIDDPERFPYVEGVTAQTITFTGTFVYAGNSVLAPSTGVTPNYAYVREFYVQKGSFITEADVGRKGLVAVMGSRTAEELFGDKDPVGEIVRLSVGGGQFTLNFSFRIVGVMEPKGATSTGDEDDLVFLPLPTMQARIPFLRHPQGLSNVNQITVRLSDRKYFDQAKEDITQLLLDRHGQEDFIIRSQEDLISTVTEVSQTLTILLGSIAGISLVVGGIGIMNIMLVSVTERTREIGIRKAVGARRRDIMMQFLVEALTVTLVGGAVGIFLGIAAAEVADGRTIGDREMSTLVTPLSVMVAFGVSATVGLFFGIYPAFSASRLNPIEALRHE
ncbi:MAG: ABC transporter permease [Dehalococcoidia bacterium]